MTRVSSRFSARPLTLGFIILNEQCFFFQIKITFLSSTFYCISQINPQKICPKQKQIPPFGSRKKTLALVWRFHSANLNSHRAAQRLRFRTVRVWKKHEKLNLVLMEESSNYSRDVLPPDQPADKRRKYWTRIEEDALVVAVKEKVVDGWRSGNGWRPGFYKQVAARIRKLVPGSVVRADPHVLSKLSSWKKDYNNLKSLFGASGQGLDPDDYSISIVGSEVWNANVRVNPDVEKMRGKSYPYYKDWKEMFGNDRAIGATAHDFGSTLEQIRNNDRLAQQQAPTPRPIPNANPDHTSETDDAASNAMPPPSGYEQHQSMSKKRKKRAGEGEEHMIALMGTYMSETKEAISELSQAIKSLKDLDPAITNVYGEVAKIAGLTMDERCKATRKMAASRTDVAIFFNMNDEARKGFVHNILYGTD